MYTSILQQLFYKIYYQENRSHLFQTNNSIVFSQTMMLYNYISNWTKKAAVYRNHLEQPIVLGAKKRLPIFFLLLFNYTPRKQVNS